MSGDPMIFRAFLAKHGEALIDQGYNVVPIQPGKKAPGFDGWQKAKPSKDQVREWLLNGHKNSGIGILTKITCAIDIDCMNSDAAKHFEEWIVEHIAKAPIRIGKFPKRLMLFRTTEPFRKKRSSIYTDEWSQKQMIEVLGDGQQFVAFHVHPDTLKPYTWVDDISPLSVRATDLPELSTDQIEKLLEEFERYARENGWDLAKSRRENNGEVDLDNPWAEDAQPIEISVDELRSRLMLIPVDGPGYEQWMNVGMALYHQFDGDEEGLALWDEWSETSMDYDKDELERKWPTFDIHGKGRSPLTARFILRLAREHVEQTARELSVKLRDAFLAAKDLAEWEKARKMAREAEIDALSRSTLAHIAKDRRDAITGTKTPIIEIKKAIAYAPKRNEQTPKWLDQWVYDTSDDRFYHLHRKIAVTKQGFDAMYDRQAMTKKDMIDGKSSPSQSASDVALIVHKIPTVDGRLYMPGRDSIFHEPNGTFANTYPEHEIPAKPEKVFPVDKRNIERVRAHISHLIEREDEQRMLLDWMAWVVQNPGRHVNYGILLQGVPGDGKTFFAEMMRAVMGVSNVSMVNAATVVGSTFTDWAYGQCVCCIEEVRLVNTRGVDKWDAINRIKPFVTNNIVEIHPKGKPVMNVKNTTSYMLFSNFKDALPLDDNDRRYNVLFSRWQHKEHIRRFKTENPNYYIRLYDTLAESPGALREWLLGHEQHESFNPYGDAPETSARRVMIRKSKSEFVQIIDDIIAEEEHWCASPHLIDVTELREIVVQRDVEWPSPKLLGTLLERDGYESLGRVRLTSDSTHFFYSKAPEMFQSLGAGGNMVSDPQKIRAYINARREAMNGDL